ncbi:MAG: YegS/Rv2252/BmrU family lipid kinase [Oscillospiraceae bacterium]|nr:YegS/Rv2252/BmrU family lipid kinase [Oscillospiraceae bacterium]
MSKKLLFVYNPMAGKAQITGYLSKIIDTFTKAGYLVTARPTLGPGDGIEVIRELARSYDLVVCSGGDGTLSESVTGIMTLPPEERPPIGYIPAGSTNDFASTLGIAKDMAEAAEMIVSGIPLRCDIGAFNDKFFTYVAAFGAFTSVSYGTPQQVKNLLGHTAYLLEGIRQVGSIKPYHLKIEVGETTIEDDFLFGMVSNTVQVGGMKIPSDVAFSINDGLFEVLMVRAPKSVADIQGMIAEALRQEVASKSFLNFKAKKIRFISDSPMPWTLDGEFGGDCVDVTVENISKAIGIVV